MRNLAESELSEFRAGPGWLVVDVLDAEAEKKSAGGIVIPQNHNVNTALMRYAKVVSCGAYYDARSGAAGFDGWPLEAGTVICYHPHTEWAFSNIDTSRRIIAIKCNDVIAVAPNGVAD